MPALPRQQAAEHLGIAVSKLRRLTADGTGKVRQGRGGRGGSTLYDTTVIAEVLRRAASPDAIDQMERGARAATLIDSLIADLRILAATGEFHRYQIPKHEHDRLASFLERWIITHVEAHLRINWLKSEPVSTSLLR